MLMMLQMWQRVAAAVMVAALAHQTSADVIVLTANQTVMIMADSPASFGPPIPLEGFKVRPRHYSYTVVANREDKETE